MKVKTSVTLSGSLLTAIDRNCGGFKSRSDFIEVAARSYLGHLSRTERDRKDLEIIDRKSGSLNREAADVLDYQASP